MASSLSIRTLKSSLLHTALAAFLCVAASCATQSTHSITPPQQHETRPIWSKEFEADSEIDTTLMITSSCLLTASRSLKRPARASSSQPTLLQCYALSTGAKRWSLEIQRGAEIRSLYTWLDVLVIQTDHTLTALDHTTGDVVWTLDTADRTIENIVEHGTKLYLQTRTIPTQKKDAHTASSSLFVFETRTGQWVQGFALDPTMKLETIAASESGPVALVLQSIRKTKHVRLSALHLSSGGAHSPTDPYPPAPTVWSKIFPNISVVHAHTNTVSIATGAATHAVLNTTTGHILYSTINPRTGHSSTTPKTHIPKTPKPTYIDPRSVLYSLETITRNGPLALTTHTKNKGVVSLNTTLTRIDPVTRKTLWSTHAHQGLNTSIRKPKYLPNGHIAWITGQRVTSIHAATGKAVWTYLLPRYKGSTVVRVQPNTIVMIVSTPTRRRTAHIFLTSNITQ